jgi:uncharacterized protein (TIGR04551 family)
MKPLRWLVVLVTVALALPAAAQMPPGMGSGGGMGPGGGRPAPKPDEEKEEGQAEAAPPSTQDEPALHPSPTYPGQAERELQFFEAHGYLRARYDFFYKFNLGFKETTYSPFPTPICSRTLNNNNTPSTTQPGLCSPNTIDGANMRFRFDPTLNVSEHVRIRAQIDMLDNLVLGSTPESWTAGQVGPGNAPIGFLSSTQVPPTAGRNSWSDSIAVKRVWGEVHLPIGDLRFGRMPSQWGMGLLANDGNCLDCDYGSTADRVMFTTRLYDHIFGGGYGWVYSGINSTQTAAWQNQYLGQGIDLDRKWGVGEWTLLAGRIDQPGEWKEKVQRGDVAVNYGTYHLFRTQQNDIKYDQGVDLSSRSDTPSAAGGLREDYVKRGAFAWIPDVWFKLSYKGLDLELEGLYILGNIDHADDISPKLDHGLKIRQWGVALRSQYRFLNDSLRVGLEIGSASGDSTENSNVNSASYLNYRNEFNPPTVGSNVYGRFRFTPDYHIDEILWRRIYGAVSNATYFKPSIAYDVIESFGARLDLVHSIANVPVGTPGNAINYGLELDLHVGYHNDDEGFYAAITYGVLFPFGALDHPATKGSETFWGTTYGGGAKIAQVVRLWVGIKF